MAFETFKNLFKGNESLQDRVLEEPGAVQRATPAASGGMDGVRQRVMAAQREMPAQQTHTQEEKTSDPIEAAMRSIKEDGPSEDTLPPSQTRAPQSFVMENEMHPAPGEAMRRAPLRPKRRMPDLSLPGQASRISPPTSLSPQERERAHLGEFRGMPKDNTESTPATSEAAGSEEVRTQTSDTPDTVAEPVTEATPAPTRNGISIIEDTINAIGASATQENNSDYEEPEAVGVQEEEQAAEPEIAAPVSTSETPAEKATSVDGAVPVAEQREVREAPIAQPMQTSSEPVSFGRNPFGDVPSGSVSSPIEEVQAHPAREEASETTSIDVDTSTSSEDENAPVETEIAETVERAKPAGSEEETATSEAAAGQTIDSKSMSADDVFHFSPKFKSEVQARIAEVPGVNEEALLKTLGKLVRAEAELHELFEGEVTEDGEPVIPALKELLEAAIQREMFHDTIHSALKAANDNRKEEARAA